MCLLVIPCRMWRWWRQMVLHGFTWRLVDNPSGGNWDQVGKLINFQHLPKVSRRREGPPPQPPTPPAAKTPAFYSVLCSSHFFPFFGSCGLRFKMGQHGPMNIGLKMGQHRPQDGATWPPRWANIAPRWANIAPRWAHITPRWANIAPR